MTSDTIETTAELSAAIDALVDRLCERRALRALRQILMAWPSTLSLTDDWGELRNALRNVLALARPDLTPEDVEVIEKCIVAIDTALRRAG